MTGPPSFTATSTSHFKVSPPLSSMSLAPNWGYKIPLSPAQAMLGSSEGTGHVPISDKCSLTTEPDVMVDKGEVSSRKNKRIFLEHLLRPPCHPPTYGWS